MKAGLHIFLFFLVFCFCTACIKRIKYKCERDCKKYLAAIQEHEEAQTNTELEPAYKIEEDPAYKLEEDPAYKLEEVPAYKLEEDPAYKIEEEPGDPGIFASRITYKISAVGIYKPNHGEKAHAYAVVNHDGNSYERDICIICSNNNPAWQEELVIDYVDGSQSYVTIQVMDETIMWGWNGDKRIQVEIGTAHFYTKNMLTKGSRLEAPLWYDDSPAGTAILEVTNVVKTRFVKKNVDS